jgi:hypothetical protein
MEVVKALLVACPHAASVPMTPGGELPLHAACTWHASPEVVMTLLRAFPNGTKATDDLKNLPLHSACFSDAAVEVVDAVLKTYPKAAVFRNGQGSTAEEICKRLHPDTKLVLSNLEQYRESYRKQRISPVPQSTIRKHHGKSSSTEAVANDDAYVHIHTHILSCFIDTFLSHTFTFVSSYHCIKPFL